MVIVNLASGRLYINGKAYYIYEVNPDERST